MGALSVYSVLDCTNEIGAPCVKILAEMGAKVTRLDQKAESSHILEAIRSADILIDNGMMKTLGLDYKDLKKYNGDLIMASITPFGQTGPYKDFKASDLTLQAMGGWMSVTGRPDAPLKLYGNQAYNTAALFAVNAVLLALRRWQATGKSQYVDISVLECVAATLDHVLPRYFAEGIVAGRQGSRHWNNAFDIFQCKDGYIVLSLQLHWETLVEWLASEGMAEDLTDAKWRDGNERNQHIDHIAEVLGKWALTHTAKELEEKGQLMHFPWAEVVKAGQ